MTAVVQRVEKASCSVDGRITGEIGKGLLVFFCAEEGDDESYLPKFLDKITKLRIFSDEDYKMNLSLIDISGEILFISQFTLAARVWKGNRPSFDRAMNSFDAEKMYLKGVEYLKGLGIRIQTGEFGSHMVIDAVNDGPVTIIVNNS